MGSGKVETWAFVSDTHWPHIHQPSWDAFSAWAKDTKPHGVVIGGDFLDFAALSRYAQEPGAKQTVADDIRQFVGEANRLLRYTTHVHVIEGNHDARWYKKILEPIAQHLPGLVGMSLHEQCTFSGLDRRIKWHIESLEWRGLQLGNMILRHGDKQTPRFGSANPARAALVRTLGRSQVFGHTHQVGLVAMGTHADVSVSVANGHMSADHSYSLENNWVRGFTILEHDKDAGFVHPYPVVIRDGRFAWRGRVFGV